MAITGFNAQSIADLHAKIQLTADGISEDVGKDLQGIIDEIAKGWWAKEAQEFSQGFIDSVNKAVVKIKESLDNYQNALRSTGVSWIVKTGNVEDREKLSGMKEIELVSFNVNAEAVQTHKDGTNDVGMDEEAMDKLVGNLTTIRESISSKIKTFGDSLSADAALLGHDQADAAEECYQKITAAIDKFFDGLIEGPDSLQTALNKFKNTYEDAAKKVASEFRRAGNGSNSAGVNSVRTGGPQVATK